RRVHHLPLRAFPTRRSSDLVEQHLAGDGHVLVGVVEEDLADFLTDAGAAGLAHLADRNPRALARPEEAAELRRLPRAVRPLEDEDRKSTRLNSSHVKISYAV